MTTINQLVYVSQAVRKMPARELLEIEPIAKENNARTDVMVRHPRLLPC